MKCLLIRTKMPIISFIVYIYVFKIEKTHSKLAAEQTTSLVYSLYLCITLRNPSETYWYLKFLWESRYTCTTPSKWKYNQFLKRNWINCVKDEKLEVINLRVRSGIWIRFLTRWNGRLYYYINPRKNQVTHYARPFRS